MTQIRIILLAVIFLNLTNCTTEKHKFPTEKRYWDTQDYAEVIRELKFGYETDEKLPTFDDPQTRIIVEKLTDSQNYNVVLEDNELGLKHRNDVAEAFFLRWKDMQDIYQATDRKDKYLYDKEMLAVWQFGLGLQLKYFKLGNDHILENADDASSTRVKNNINSNISTLIENYIIYLDGINDEDALSDDGKSKFSAGIDEYFTQLVELYPDANYNRMESKIELMEKKTKSDKIKNSLNKLNHLIVSKKTQEE
jgi:hypothetical protein